MWRRVFRLISCVCVCVWLMCGVGKIEVSAIASGMESVSLTELEKQEFIDNLCIEMVPGDTARWPIQCFDIREDGTIALAIDSNIIYVYDPSGRFQYGYSFQADGDFGIAFQGDLIAIYFTRGDIVALIDANGNCVDVLKLIGSYQDFMYINEFLRSTTKDSCGKTYMLERDIDIGGSYSRLVAVGEHGDRTVLYDVTSAHKAGQILWMVTMVCFATFVLWGLIKKNMVAQ